MTRLLLVIGLATIVIYAAGTVSNQRAAMKWSHECVHVQQDTYYEAPMKDGAPDLSNGKVHKLLIDKSCGVIEVER